VDVNLQQTNLNHVCKFYMGDNEVNKHCHTLILDLKILVQFSVLISNTLKFTVFSTVLQTHIVLLLSSIFLHLKPSKVFFLRYKPFKRVSKTIAYFPAFYSNFLHKIIQKGILVISYKGTHFSLYNLSLSFFNWSA